MARERPPRVNAVGDLVLTDPRAMRVLAEPGPPTALAGDLDALDLLPEA